MTDRFTEALHAYSESEVPETPEALVSAARDRAERLRAARRRTARTRLVAGGSVALALTGASLTPPGRAAAEWLGGLAGVGEQPSTEQLDVVPGSPVVFRSGTLSDGTPYEFVAKRIDGRSIRPTFARSPLHEAICFQVDWVGIGRGGEGGACMSDRRSRGGRPLETSAFLQPPGNDPARPGIFFGLVAPGFPSVAEVGVMYEPRNEDSRTLVSELIDVSDSSFASLGPSRTGQVFFSAIDGEVVADEVKGDARIYAVARDDEGQELGRAHFHDPLDAISLRDLFEREIGRGYEPDEVTRLDIAGKELRRGLSGPNPRSLRRAIKELLAREAGAKPG